MLDRLRRAGLVGATVALAPALALLLGLGVWQWQRRAWKEELIAAIAARSKAIPVDIAEIVRRGCQPVAAVGIASSCEYAAVRLTGTFDHAGERHIFISVPMQAEGVGGPGYWIMTPFRTSDGIAIYVNRGFVPEARKDPQSRAQGQVAGIVQIAGVLRSAEQRSWFSGTNAVEKNVYFVRDPIELESLPLPKGGIAGRPISAIGGVLYVDQTGGPPPGGLPLPLALRIRLPNRHLEYALTWWALAGTLLAVYVALARARLKGPSEEGSGTGP